MGFLDVVYVLIFFFVLLIAVNVGDTAFRAVMPSLNGTFSNATYNDMYAQHRYNNTFFDNSFAALFLLFCGISIILTALLVSHPGALAAWLLINLVTLFLYDVLSAFLAAFMLGPLNTGAMANAYDFWLSGVPKLVCVANIFLAVVLFGKRVTA